MKLLLMHRRVMADTMSSGRATGATRTPGVKRETWSEFDSS
jgi:hypothetical protein